MMAMVVELLMGVKDSSKVQNRWVAKSWIVLIPNLIILILVKSLFHDSSFIAPIRQHMLLGKKERIDRRTNQFKKQQYTVSN